MNKAGIYVHIPFCVKKCNYCDFNSFASGEHTQNEYINSLISEITQFAKIKNLQADSVFIGGGTPTLLSENHLEKLIVAINESFSLDKNTEFTIECNPKTASLKKFRLLKSLGVNRLSIGVQSLNDKILKTLGRCHNTKDFLECFAAAKIAGFENINFDLMFAVPNQKQKTFEKTVRDAIKLAPAHISAYGLQLEENTYFYENKDTYNFPSDEQNRKMYEFLVDYLKDNDYRQYEISNFAKDGYACKHNLKYWDLTDYVGFGLGSSSFFENARYQNPADLGEYFDFCNNFTPLWENAQKQAENDLIEEFMFLGLRLTKGVSNTDFVKKFGKSMFDIYEKVIEKNLNLGLLNRDRDSIFLSKKGFDLANSVMSDFLLD